MAGILHEPRAFKFERMRINGWLAWTRYVPKMVVPKWNKITHSHVLWLVRGLTMSHNAKL